MPQPEDPVLINSRREAVIILVTWAAATLYCCLTCYFLGYIRDGQPRGVDDLNPILGMPSWFFWGVVVPWFVCALVTFWFTGFVMVDDDLGEDHAADLEAEIREEGEHHHV